VMLTILMSADLMVATVMISTPLKEVYVCVLLRRCVYRCVECG